MLSLVQLVSLFTFFSSFVGLASAANSFAGSNLYYATGLDASQRATLLDGMQSAGMKVLRVWMDAQSSATTKNTTITAYPNLEPETIGVFNDTVLNLLDDFMLDSHQRGIKLMISMHSFNALQGGDVYGTEYNISSFYESRKAQCEFDHRLRHVMNHVHTTLGRPWKELSEYIFAFEAENEAMIGNGQQYIIDHQEWQCDRAATIKHVLGHDSGILVTTGGASWLDESVQTQWLECPYIDIVAVHAYGVGDFNTTKIQTYIDRAIAANSSLIFQEWGACYYDTLNNVCNSSAALDTATRNENLAAWAGQITAAGLPWMYWQILPNDDPHYNFDYEIGVNTDPSWETLKNASLTALQSPAVFDFSHYLL